MLTPKDITLERQIQCVAREIAFRKRLYPRWIENKKLTADEAREEIVAMEAVRETLESLKRPAPTAQAALPLG